MSILSEIFGSSQRNLYQDKAKEAKRSATFTAGAKVFQPMITEGVRAVGDKVIKPIANKIGSDLKTGFEKLDDKLDNKWQQKWADEVGVSFDPKTNTYTGSSGTGENIEYFTFGENVRDNFIDSDLGIDKTKTALFDKEFRDTNLLVDENLTGIDKERTLKYVNKEDMDPDMIYGDDISELYPGYEDSEQYKEREWATRTGLYDFDEESGLFTSGPFEGENIYGGTMSKTDYDTKHKGVVKVREVGSNVYRSLDQTFSLKHDAPEVPKFGQKGWLKYQTQNEGGLLEGLWYPGKNKEDNKLHEAHVETDKIDQFRQDHFESYVDLEHSQQKRRKQFNNEIQEWTDADINDMDFNITDKDGNVIRDFDAEMNQGVSDLIEDISFTTNEKGQKGYYYKDDKGDTHFKTYRREQYEKDNQELWDSGFFDEDIDLDIDLPKDWNETKLEEFEDYHMPGTKENPWTAKEWDDIQKRRRKAHDEEWEWYYDTEDPDLVEFNKLEDFQQKNAIRLNKQKSMRKYKKQQKNLLKIEEDKAKALAEMYNSPEFQASFSKLLGVSNPGLSGTETDPIQMPDVNVSGADTNIFGGKFTPFKDFGKFLERGIDYDPNTPGRQSRTDGQQDEWDDLDDVKSFKHGGTYMTDGPELILVGDNASGKEIVNVEPLENQGRFGDSELRNVDGLLSHVNPWEAYMIDKHGKKGEKKVKETGSGTINPKTGMPEYFSFGAPPGNPLITGWSPTQTGASFLGGNNPFTSTFSNQKFSANNPFANLAAGQNAVSTASTVTSAATSAAGGMGFDPISMGVGLALDAINATKAVDAAKEQKRELQNELVAADHEFGIQHEQHQEKGAYAQKVMGRQSDSILSEAGKGSTAIKKSTDNIIKGGKGLKTGAAETFADEAITDINESLTTTFDAKQEKDNMAIQDMNEKWRQFAGQTEIKRKDMQKQIKELGDFGFEDAFMGGLFG